MADYTRLSAAALADALARLGSRQEAKALLADLDGRAYAVVRDSEEPSPGTWGWLTGVRFFSLRILGSVSLTIALATSF